MLVNYCCKTCDNKISKLIDDPDDLLGVLPCGQCSGFLERIFSGPSSNSIETIDTGFMPNTVEYDAERAAQRKEASRLHFKEIYGKKD